MALGAARGRGGRRRRGATFGVLALQNKSDYQKNPTFSNTDNGNNDAAYADGCAALAVAAGVTSLVLFLTRHPTADARPPHPGARGSRWRPSSPRTGAAQARSFASRSAP